MKPVVIQTENLPEECSNWLAQRCDLHICPADSLRFKELLPKAQGLVIRTYTTVDQTMLEQAPELKVVGRAGAGAPAGSAVRLTPVGRLVRRRRPRHRGGCLWAVSGDP